ncbi:MAG TPA: preprotein translocase subunit YajC, partial [Acidimicrobiales bacterium]|nr:preprotein translocase subunit YajC [Acidimicrobiales bacterium]
SIEVGDEVLTAGGIVGHITALEDDRVDIQVAPGVTLTFLRGAITRRLGPERIEEEEPRDHGEGGAPGEGLG